MSSHATDLAVYAKSSSSSLGLHVTNYHGLIELSQSKLAGCDVIMRMHIPDRKSV